MAIGCRSLPSHSGTQSVTTSARFLSSKLGEISDGYYFSHSWDASSNTWNHLAAAERTDYKLQDKTWENLRIEELHDGKVFLNVYRVAIKIANAQNQVTIPVSIHPQTSANFPYETRSFLARVRSGYYTQLHSSRGGVALKSSGKIGSKQSPNQYLAVGSIDIDGTSVLQQNALGFKSPIGSRRNIYQLTKGSIFTVMYPGSAGDPALADAFGIWLGETVANPPENVVVLGSFDFAKFRYTWEPVAAAPPSQLFDEVERIVGNGIAKFSVELVGKEPHLVKGDKPIEIKDDFLFGTIDPRTGDVDHYNSSDDYFASLAEEDSIPVAPELKPRNSSIYRGNWEFHKQFQSGKYDFIVHWEKVRPDDFEDRNIRVSIEIAKNGKVIYRDRERRDLADLSPDGFNYVYQKSAPILSADVWSFTFYFSRKLPASCSVTWNKAAIPVLSPWSETEIISGNCEF
jgi:hypothetical protein